MRRRQSGTSAEPPDGSSPLRKDRIVLEGLRGEDSIAELCRKEGIAQNLYLDDRTPPDGCVKRSRWIFTSRRNSASYLPRSHNQMRHMQ